MTKKFNHFHAVEMSPWAFCSFFAAVNLMMSLILWFHNYTGVVTVFSIIIIILLMQLWWRDIERESKMGGFHTDLVKAGLKYGMIFFIISEVLFFMSFFWTFVHSSSSCDFELGVAWPPAQMLPFNPLGVPLVNTIILLSSGVSVTWAHHLSFKGSVMGFSVSMFITIVLGVVFSFLQASEYTLASFCLPDGVMGSIFFMSTGFHGLHVLIGSSFLTVVYLKHTSLSNTSSQNVGFECSAWYWHFVDVVWLFLYSVVYWWGA